MNYASPFIPPLPLGASNGGEPGFFDMVSAPGGAGMGGAEASNPDWFGTPFPAQHAIFPPLLLAPPPTPAPAAAAPQRPYVLTPVTALVPVQAAAPAWPPQQAPVFPAAPVAAWAAPTPAPTPGLGLAPPTANHVSGGPWSAPPAPYRELSAPEMPFESGWGQPIPEGWFGDGDVEKKNKKKRRRRRSMGDDRCMHTPAPWKSPGCDRWDGFGEALGLYDERDRPLSFPAYARDDIFDERNLARRPRDWREDYTPRGLACSMYLPRLGKSRSDVKEWTDLTRRALHPLLLFQPSSPAMHFNLRSPSLDPECITVLTHPAPRAANAIDFYQLAFQPPAGFMRLYHPKLPWYVDIRTTHANGVTVRDVIEQMHAQMQTQVHPRHFWNKVLGDAGRAGVSHAFWERCGRDEGLVEQGVLQVDFLGRKVVFEGLVRGPRGMWEIKTSTPN